MTSNTNYHYLITSRRHNAITSSDQNTLLCLIVRGSNKMHQGEKYQDFLKWGEVVSGHSIITIK